MAKLKLILLYLYCICVVCKGQNCSTPANYTNYKVSNEEWSRFRTQYSLYGSWGSFSVLGNSFILVAILHDKECRKKYRQYPALHFQKITLLLHCLQSYNHG